MKNTFSAFISTATITACFGIFAGTANAVPSLQLGIAGGVYDWTPDDVAAHQTVVATSSSFSLYAYLHPDRYNLFGDTYFLSMAVTPEVSTPTDLGSFTYDSNIVRVTSGMTFGTPPVNTLFPDIPSHHVFPTWYKEISFQFSEADKSGVFNTEPSFPDTQIAGGWGPHPVSGQDFMYFKLFNIDTSNLAVGSAIHFDLYNTNIKTTCSGNSACGYTKVAPFSHDAQSMTSVVTAVPEPETYAMLLAGLGLVAFSARRRLNNNA